jgi:putative ubiquitin-RnfH superfamily antitoxin RatB of RatAB toxin-antitoxin module
MNITVVYAPAQREAAEWTLDLPDGSTAQMAVMQCGVLQHYPELLEQLARGDVSMGVWGRACPASQPLIDQDRVELYRSLRVDPKVARRERFKGQGARSAGLFAKKRAGSKAGY